MNIRRMLAHNAGLVSWIPFYNKTMSRGQLKYDVYSTAFSPIYSIKVSDGLYIKKEYSDSIRHWITNHGIHGKKNIVIVIWGIIFIKIL